MVAARRFDDDRNTGVSSGLGGGLFVVRDGIRLLRRERRLWLLASVPVFFALLSVGGAVSVLWLHVGEIHGAAAGVFPTLEADAWWTWLWVGPGRALFWLLGWLAVVAVFAISVVGALLVANLASAPFLDQLSQRVEALVLREPWQGASGWSGVLRETLRSFAAELQRIGFLGGIWLLLTGVGFVVPGAHFVTGPLLVGLTILFLPLDYAGFALDRRQVSFRARRAWLRANLATMVGFGSVAFLACLVPGLNLLLMPVMVTAGTLLVLRRSPSDSAVVI